MMILYNMFVELQHYEDIEELDKFIAEIKELPVVMVIDFKLLREIDNND